MIMVQAKRRSQLTIDIEAGKHSIVSDVSPSLGGLDLGPSPHQILETALATCTSITVQMYANRKGWPLESCNVQVQFVQEDKEAIVIERTLEFLGPLNDEQKKRLFQIAEKCPIHEVLVRGSKVLTKTKTDPSASSTS